MKPLRSGIVGNLTYPAGISDVNFGLEYTGYIRIDRAGMYEFALTSDDGSRLAIDNEEVILNDGQHAMVEVPGSVYLTKGYHTIDVSFFQAGGPSGLQLTMQGPDGKKIPVRNDVLFCGGK